MIEHLCLCSLLLNETEILHADRARTKFYSRAFPIQLYFKLLSALMKCFRALFLFYLVVGKPPNETR